MFGAKRTVESVARELQDGLSRGTVQLDPSVLQARRLWFDVIPLMSTSFQRGHFTSALESGAFFAALIYIGTRWFFFQDAPNPGAINRWPEVVLVFLLVALPLVSLCTALWVHWKERRDRQRLSDVLAEYTRHLEAIQTASKMELIDVEAGRILQRAFARYLASFAPLNDRALATPETRSVQAQGAPLDGV